MQLLQYPNINDAGVPNELQWKQTQTISREECRYTLGELAQNIHSNNLCTLNAKGRGVCIGDSGNPLVNEKGICVGIVSWGFECGRIRPNVYTRVYPYLAYIYGVTGVRPPQQYD